MKIVTNDKEIERTENISTCNVVPEKCFALLDKNLREENRKCWGVPEKWLKYAINYFNGNKKDPIYYLKKHQITPENGPILDLGSGCGMFVLSALQSNYDCYGLEPELWRIQYCYQKITTNKYVPSYRHRFVNGIGETLPFRDEYFQYVNSHQTLEHVVNVAMVIREMLRITKIGGKIHIQCPDFSGSYEGHYRLPWLPFFPKYLAKWYLRILGRPTAGLDTLQYVTKRSLERELRQAKELGMQCLVVDLEWDEFINAKPHKNITLAYFHFTLCKIYRYLRKLFRAETNANLLIVRTK